MKKIFTIFILLFAACTTEPVEVHDDNAVLQKLFNDPTIECAELPDSICVWENGRITILNCYNKSLTRGIPENIGKLTELTKLGLKSNNFNGGIPESIGKLTNLTQLSLSNNLLNGSLPESLSNLSKLILLDVSNNNLEGSVPSTIGNLSGLYTFLVNSNNFSGSIPESLCDIGNLDVSNNQFCESQPYCIDTPELMGYQSCECSTNEEVINGYCYSQTDLTILSKIISNADSINMNLDIDSSGIVDPLELGIQKWHSGRLKQLDCYWEAENCSISGNLPANIENLDSLEYLDVQQNSLTGNIPETISNLTNLKYLNISYNQLSGSVPDNFCGENSSLNEIIVTNNKLCPCYPDCIEDTGEQDISECINCDVGFTLICDDLPATVSIIEGDSLCFRESNLTVLQAFIDSSPATLDMGMDADSSGIIEPLELGTQYWKDENLDSLYAQGRGLSGQIPSVLDSLESLQAIWLYNNYFSGQIPESICSLSNLDWDSTGGSSLKSYIYNNQLCPPYPDCIALFVGEQDTTNCSQFGPP